MHAPQSKGIFTYDRFQIPYRVFGTGENIVCVNGAQQSMAMWFSFLHHFKEKYRIILFDFPYQGKSKIVFGSPHVTLKEQVGILQAVIDKLDIKQATVCSSSWGGVIALLFAAHFPQYAKRLILASVGLRPNNLMREVILKGTNMGREDRKKLAEVIINNFGKNLPQEVKNQIIKQFQAMKEEQIRAFSEHGMSVILAKSLDKIIPLSKITTNATIVYGENDTIIDFYDVEAMSFLMPNCSIKIVPGTGHFLHLENDKVFSVYEQIFNLEPSLIR